MKIEEVEIHNWMPAWAIRKFHNCPIFRRVMMEANRQRLNREQTLWMLCEVLYTDRDIWKGEALELARNQPPICPKCKNEIDPEVCHCGDLIKSHGIGSGHAPVPMGCTCGYNRQIMKPKIVCLCGSTRFFQHFMDANYRETMVGNIVLSVGFYPHASEQAHGQNIGITEQDKVRLDELHKRKIDLADEVLVLNVGGYIGESTRSEISYAKTSGKPIRYLEPVE